MSRVKLAALAAAGVVLIAGCASNAPGDLSASAARVLRPAVEQVRQAAATGTYADLRQAVQQLKDLVKQEEQAGEVSSQRATAIEDAADVLLTDARPSASPSPSPTSESPTPTPTTASPTPTTESPTPTTTPTSASPTPSSSGTPIVSLSAAARAPHGSPHSSPTPRSSPTR